MHGAEMAASRPKSDRAGTHTSAATTLSTHTSTRRPHATLVGSTPRFGCDPKPKTSTRTLVRWLHSRLAMLRAGECVVVLEPSATRLQVWTELARRLPLRITPVTSWADALDAMVDEGAAALVATGFSVEEGIALVRCARALHPPAEVVLITDDVEALRGVLHTTGLYAEVLRGPANVTDLVRRLGAPSGAFK